MPLLDRAFVEIEVDLRGFDRDLDRAEDRFDRAVRSMSGRDVGVGVSRSMGALSGGLRKATGLVGGLTGAFGGLVRTLGSASLIGLPLLGGVGVAGGIGFAVKSAIDLESQIADLRKTTGIEGGPLAALSENLKELAATLPGVSLSDVFQGAIEAGRLGVARGGPESLLEFVRATSMLKVAIDDLPIEETTTALGQMMENFDLGTDSMLGLGSAANKLGDTSNALVGDILRTSSTASLAANQFGLSAEETMAFATVLKEAGLRTETAGANFGKVLGKMLSDTEKFATATGIPLEEFKQLIRDNPVAAIGELAGAFSKLETFAQRELMEQLGLGDLRVGRVLTTLGTRFDTVAEKIALANHESATNASVTAEVSARAETAAAQLQLMWNKVTMLAAEFGGSLLDAIKAASAHIGNFSDHLRSMAEGGGLDAFAASMVRVADAVAGAFLVPEGATDLFRAALDVMVAAADVAGEKISDALFGDLKARLKTELGLIGKLIGVTGEAFDAVLDTGMKSVDVPSGVEGLTPEEMLGRGASSRSDPELDRKFRERMAGLGVQTEAEAALDAKMSDFEARLGKLADAGRAAREEAAAAAASAPGVGNIAGFGVGAAIDAARRATEDAAAPPEFSAGFGGFDAGAAAASAAAAKQRGEMAEMSLRDAIAAMNVIGAMGGALGGMAAGGMAASAAAAVEKGPARPPEPPMTAEEALAAAMGAAGSFTGAIAGVGAGGMAATLAAQAVEQGSEPLRRQMMALPSLMAERDEVEIGSTGVESLNKVIQGQVGKQDDKQVKLAEQQVTILGRVHEALVRRPRVGTV